MVQVGGEEEFALPAEERGLGRGAAGIACAEELAERRVRVAGDFAADAATFLGLDRIGVQTADVAYCVFGCPASWAALQGLACSGFALRAPGLPKRRLAPVAGSRRLDRVRWAVTDARFSVSHNGPESPFAPHPRSTPFAPHPR